MGYKIFSITPQAFAWGIVVCIFIKNYLVRVRYIMVPENKVAQDQEQLELKLKEKAFAILWDSQLFAEIGSHANTTIENYEDSEITDKQLLEAVLKSGLFDNAKYAKLECINELKSFFEAALSRGTGIQFYF